MPQDTAAPRIARNEKLLELPARAAVVAVVVPVLFGAALDSFALAWSRGVPPGLTGFIIFVDLAIGVWQGILLGKAMLAQAAAPPSAGSSFIFLLGRGAFIGTLVGLVNGLIMAPVTGPAFILMSGLIGLILGSSLGLLAAVPFSLYMRKLEPAPGRSGSDTNGAPQA